MHVQGNSSNLIILFRKSNESRKWIIREIRFKNLLLFQKRDKKSINMTNIIVILKFNNVTLID